jgi:hypothetical protein
MTTRGVTVVVALLLFCGCNSKAIYQGIYEGSRVRQQLQTTPGERVGRQELPDYQSYDSMRSSSSRAAGAPTPVAR